jgi:hypothetical protein
MLFTLINFLSAFVLNVDQLYLHVAKSFTNRYTIKKSWVQQKKMDGDGKMGIRMSQ